jgi:hypothetical protein
MRYLYESLKKEAVACSNRSFCSRSFRYYLFIYLVLTYYNNNKYIEYFVNNQVMVT